MHTAESTPPSEDMAIKASSVRSACGPYTFLNRSAATRRPEVVISCFVAPAKYAMLTSIYNTVTAAVATGPAILTVRLGFLTSDRA